MTSHIYGPCTTSYLGDLRLHLLFFPPLDSLARKGTRNDKRKWNLPAVLVRYSDDTSIRHKRVIEEMSLEFCRCDLETAYFHDLLNTVNNKKVIIGIDDSFIACADPSGKASS